MDSVGQSVTRILRKDKCIKAPQETKSKVIHLFAFKKILVGLELRCDFVYNPVFCTEYQLAGMKQGPTGEEENLMGKHTEESRVNAGIPGGTLAVSNTALSLCVSK